MSGMSPQLEPPTALVIRPGRIDPGRLVDGKAPAVEAGLTRRDDTDGIGRRHYELTDVLAGVRVQLNHGEAADDPTRLRDVAEQLLSTADAPRPGGEA